MIPMHCDAWAFVPQAQRHIQCELDAGHQSRHRVDAEGSMLHWSEAVTGSCRSIFLDRARSLPCLGAAWHSGPHWWGPPSEIPASPGARFRVETPTNIVWPRRTPEETPMPDQTPIDPLDTLMDAVKAAIVARREAAKRIGEAKTAMEADPELTEMLRELLPPNPANATGDALTFDTTGMNPQQIADLIAKYTEAM